MYVFLYLGLYLTSGWLSTLCSITVQFSTVVKLNYKDQKDLMVATDKRHLDK